MGRLDIVVANAGICAMGKGQTIQSWSDTIDTDLVGAFNVIQASLPHVNDGASIIATGSLAAQLGSATNQGPGGSAYSLAKQMVARYVNDLSVQLAKRMIRVNAVHPTNVYTDMLHNEGQQRGVPRQRRFPLHHGHAAASGRRRIRQGEALQGLSLVERGGYGRKYPKIRP